jgi:hypothetical protein
MTFVVDGGGAVPSTGAKGQIFIPYPLIITNWQVYADATGSIAFDLKKATSFTTWPAQTTMNTGGTAPSLVAKRDSTGTTVGWADSTGAFGNIVEVNVLSDATVTQASLVLLYYRT